MIRIIFLKIFSAENSSFFLSWSLYEMRFFKSLPFKLKNIVDKSALISLANIETLFASKPLIPCYSNCFHSHLSRIDWVMSVLECSTLLSQLTHFTVHFEQMMAPPPAPPIPPQQRTLFISKIIQGTTEAHLQF